MLFQQTVQGADWFLLPTGGLRYATTTGYFLVAFQAEGLMKRIESGEEDNLRPEYDFFSEGVATGLRLRDATLSGFASSVNGGSFPGLPKRNPGLKFANAFSVNLKLHHYLSRLIVEVQA